MNNDLISRSALNKEMLFNLNQEITKYKTMRRALGNVARTALDCVEAAPAVDAEPVRHEGNTIFVTTNNLDSYADRIIVGQGNLCKVYYADEPVRHGRWIRLGPNWYECSACKERTSIFSGAKNYCPNCGAKMDGDNDA